MTERLLALLLDELAADPVALDRLCELVGRVALPTEATPAAAYTVATLAVELGRTVRSIRGAIARDELQAVKRGRGYVISADAVAEWAQAPGLSNHLAQTATSPRRRRSGAGPMRRALQS